MSPWRARRVRTIEWRLVLFLVIVWMVMWGRIDLFTFLAGVVVALAVVVVFPLPPLRIGVRVRPLAAAYLIGRFLVDVIRATYSVARVVLGRNPDVPCAVVRVDLATRSDLILTLTAEMTTLIPGSVVIGVSQEDHALYLHVLNVPDAESAERFRDTVRQQEGRLARAIGREVDVKAWERAQRHTPQPESDRLTPEPQDDDAAADRAEDDLTGGRT